MRLAPSAPHQDESCLCVGGVGLLAWSQPLASLTHRILPEPEEAMLPMVPELPEISFELPLDKDMLTLTDVRRCEEEG